MFCSQSLTISKLDVTEMGIVSGRRSPQFDSITDSEISITTQDSSHDYISGLNI